MTLRECIKYAATADITQTSRIIVYSNVMNCVASSCARINSSSRIIRRGLRRFPSTLKDRTLKCTPEKLVGF